MLDRPGDFGCECPRSSTDGTAPKRRSSSPVTLAPPTLLGDTSAQERAGPIDEPDVVQSEKRDVSPRGGHSGPLAGSEQCSRASSATSSASDTVETSGCAAAHLVVRELARRVDGRDELVPLLDARSSLDGAGARPLTPRWTRRWRPVRWCCSWANSGA